MLADTDRPGSPDATEVVVAARFAGPPGMGHGGYVAGLFATGSTDPVTVTLRRPTPLDVPQQIVDVDGRRELRDPAADGAVIATAEAGTLDLDVPAPPSLDAVIAAEAASPSHFHERGVHPTCFGCGLRRGDDAGPGLAIAAGPVDVGTGGPAQVAGRWTPSPDMRNNDGVIDPQFVAAALDCTGAFAFISDKASAGLLGRITFAQHAPVDEDAPLIVTGWQVGVDGKKMLAGTALFTADGARKASALATWFPFG